jgi:hypothetical protein
MSPAPPLEHEQSPEKLGVIRFSLAILQPARIPLEHPCPRGFNFLRSPWVVWVCVVRDPDGW